MLEIWSYFAMSILGFFFVAAYQTYQEKQNPIDFVFTFVLGLLIMWRFFI